MGCGRPVTGIRDMIEFCGRAPCWELLNVRKERVARLSTAPEEPLDEYWDMTGYVC